jgi:glycosyltransferase involved in cell wall biosynthesis
MQVAKGRKHVVTFRDPGMLRDWWLELERPSSSRLQVLANLVYEDNPLVRRSVRRADAVYCAAEHLSPKAQRKYRLRSAPVFLPTPVDVPERVDKAATPTVCFNGRWDRRKRPELFFELARDFPGVRFIAVGGSRDAAWEAKLRSRYGRVPNLDMVGFVDQFATDRLARILDLSWVLVSTSTREGLPNTFLEAAAHRCALLSRVDPDGFASRSGHHVQDGDFAGGLRHLLEGDRWRSLGEIGQRYVRERFETGVATLRHLEAYERVLSS